MITPENEHPLALWDKIAHIIRSGTVAGDRASEIIDGPLSDLEMLVQIPAVRSLVEDVVDDCASQWGADYLWDKHVERFARPWIDALDADRLAD